jgi:hypothetical protein
MDDYSEYVDQCIIEIQKSLSQPDSAYKLHKNSIKTAEMMIPSKN